MINMIQQGGKPMKLDQGFSITEIMVSISIFAILFMFASPIYTQYMIKTHRSEAKLGLIKLALAQEQRRMMTTTYTYNTALLGASTSLHQLYRFVSLRGRVSLPPGSCSANTIPIGGGDSLHYTLVAIPELGTLQAEDDQCGCLYINDLGQKGSTGSETSEKCWG